MRGGRRLQDATPEFRMRQDQCTKCLGRLYVPLHARWVVRSGLLCSPTISPTTTVATDDVLEQAAARHGGVAHWQSGEGRR